MEYLIVGLFGLMMGSFAGMLVYRLIDGKPIMKLSAQRSYCPECETDLKWYHNIPVISYAVLGGKCGFCKTSISWHYPAIELTVSAAFMLVFWHYHAEITDGNLVDAARMMVFAYALVLIAYTDIISGYIFNKVTYPLIAIGLGTSFISNEITPIEAVTGASVGFATLWTLNAAHKRLRGIDGMGWGDFKLMAMVGAFLGPYGAVMTMSVGPTICVVLVTVMFKMGVVGGQAREGGDINNINDVEFTFGQYLAFGAFITILYSYTEAMTDLYGLLGVTLQHQN